MKFTAALLLAPLAAAAPAAVSNPAHNGTAPDPSTYENVDITSLYISETLSSTLAVLSIDRVDFVINGNTTCGAANPGLQGDVFGCDGDSPYSFGLINGTTSEFALRIYKQTAPFVGFYGSGDVYTYCHSGGGSSENCAQVADSTIVIS